MAIKRSQYQKALRPKQVSNPVVAQARRRRMYKIFGITTLWLLALGATAAALLSPWTLVTSVVLTGVNDTSDRSVVRTVQQSVRQSCIYTTCGRLWQVRYDPLATILRVRYPWADQVLLDRQFPGTVELKVVEDESRIRICLPSGQCYRIAPKGTGSLIPLAPVRDARVSIAIAASSNDPKLTSATALWLQGVARILPGLPLLESPLILSANSLTDTEYTLSLTGGRKALLSTSVDPATIRELLLALPQLGSDPVTFDLRFPERVYYRLPAPVVPADGTPTDPATTPAAGVDVPKDSKKVNDKSKKE
jgi:hypothetical protein